MNEKSVFPLEIRIRLQSYKLTSLNRITEKLKRIALDSNLSYSSINLPVKKERITLLKSPHVNKKAKDQYEICCLNRLVILRGCFPLCDFHTIFKTIEIGDVVVKLTFSLCCSHNV